MFVRNVKSRIKNQAQDNNLLLPLCQKDLRNLWISIEFNVSKKEYF